MNLRLLLLLNFIFLLEIRQTHAGGTASYRRSGDVDWNELSDDYAPAAGDKIRTETRTAIDLGHGVTAELGPGSLFALKAVKGAAKSAVLAVGSVRLIAPKAGGATVKLRAPSGVGWGKNVDFSAEIDAAGSTTFSVATGRLSATDESGNETLLKRGQSITLSAMGLGQSQAAAEQPPQQSPEAPPSPAAAPGPNDPVTFVDVMRDPDNTELSYRYALGEVQKGSLKTAVSALERVLLVDPNQHKVRLLYAVVLYRLDNLNDSERELNNLSALPLPEALRAEITQYKTAIKKRLRRTRASGSLAAAFVYDSNRNAAPASDLRQVLNAFISVTGSNLKRQDTGIIGIATARVDRDLGFQAGHSIFANLSYYRAEQNVVRTGNLQAYSWQAGAVIKTRLAQLTPYGAFDNVSLVQETFLRTQGGGLKAERKLSPKLSLSLEGKLSYQEYLRTEIVRVAPERSGRQGSLSLGASYALTPTMGLTAGYGWTQKSAARGYNAYDRHSFTLGYLWLLGGGRFANITGSGIYDRYNCPDPLVSITKIRRDDAYRIRVSFGTPLSFIAKFLKTVQFTQSYEYYHSYSNIINYSYDNNKTESMLTYRWEL